MGCSCKLSVWECKGTQGDSHEGNVGLVKWAGAGHTYGTKACGLEVPTPGPLKPLIFHGTVNVLALYVLNQQ